MEFEFTVPGLASQYISLWDAAAIGRLAPEHFHNLKEVLDTFGKRSAKAQGLGVPVTDIYRLRSTDQRLYLVATRSAGITTVHGGLKIGLKKLFLRNEAHALHELQPTCVLDFYVHESCQRQGLGKQLFQSFLETEQLHPGSLAYDRPSPKLIAFLAKHFGLRDCLTQTNNYVIYSCFWQYNQQSSHSIRAAGRYAARPVQPQRAIVLPAVQAPSGMARQHTQEQALMSASETGHGHVLYPPGTVSSQQHGCSTGSREVSYAQHELASREQQELGHSMHSTDSMHSSSMAASHGAGLHHRDSLDNFKMLTCGTSLDNQGQPSAKLPFHQSAATSSSSAAVSISNSRPGVYATGLAAAGAPAGPSVLGSVHTIQGPATLYKAVFAPRASIATPQQGGAVPGAFTHPDHMQASAMDQGPCQRAWPVGATTSSMLVNAQPYNSECSVDRAPQLSSRSGAAFAGQLHGSRPSASYSLGGPQWVRPPWGSDNDEAPYRSHLDSSAGPKPAVGCMQLGIQQAVPRVKQAGVVAGAYNGSRAGSRQGLGSFASGASIQTPGNQARVLAAASRSGAGAAGCLGW